MMQPGMEMMRGGDGMEGQMMAAAQQLMSFLPVLPTAGFLLAGYTFITIDRRREGSLSKDDKQAGLKLVLFALMLVSLMGAAGGVETLLHYILSGAKTGSGALKMSLAVLIASGGAFAIFWLVFLPKTNSKEAPQPERFFLGAVAAMAGGKFIAGLGQLTSMLFLSAPWPFTSQSFAVILVNGGLMFFALARFGSLSGWTTPVRQVPPANFPPQGGGYPPQGGGYPPQGGGYPPQGGGYPQQGGGYPQQGGGYPPQGGGGYPPA
jgi:hypothetical protein